jgi:hypothetical protein
MWLVPPDAIELMSRAVERLDRRTMCRQFDWPSAQSEFRGGRPLMAAEVEPIRQAAADRSAAPRCLTG